MLFQLVQIFSPAVLIQPLQTHLFVFYQRYSGQVICSWKKFVIWSHPKALALTFGRLEGKLSDNDEPVSETNKSTLFQAESVAVFLTPSLWNLASCVKTSMFVYENYFEHLIWCIRQFASSSRVVGMSFGAFQSLFNCLPELKRSEAAKALVKAGVALINTLLTDSQHPIFFLILTTLVTSY